MGHPAKASEAASDTDVRNAQLAVNNKGEALITYTRRDGTVRHVLVWGAVNAIQSGDGTTPQVRFHYDYSGGWGKYHQANYWQTFRDTCQPYDGPTLVYQVTACKAPDGSYWALQSWQRGLPLLGFQPWTQAQKAFELHISHWTGPLAQLVVGVHWTYGGSAVGLFGRFTYAGQPVHGYHSTGDGNPKDRYGRTVYIDTQDSVYGPGWQRESGILVHNPNGTFCHSFVPQKPFPGYPDLTMRPAAPGTAYRVTVMGPGVTPVVQAIVGGLPSWNGSPDQQRIERDSLGLWNQFMDGDAHCAPEQGT